MIAMSNFELSLPSSPQFYKFLYHSTVGEIAFLLMQESSKDLCDFAGQRFDGPYNFCAFSLNFLELILVDFS